MVRIINYSERIAEDGKKFFSLSVQGGIEMIRSKTTNNFYATAKKASITSTFNEETCKALVGTELPGKVVKQVCEPYEYTVEDTGEIIVLNHRYVFMSEEEMESIPTSIEADIEAFSKNGHLETAM